MFEQAGNLIRSRFANTVNVPVQYDNGPIVDESSIWIRHTIAWGAVNRLELGPISTYRLVGVMFAQLRQPVDLGDGALLSLADIIADAFRSVSFSGVTFRTPSVSSHGRDGSWWLVNVQCPFFYDEVA